MKGIMRRAERGERGASAVEFALVLMPLLLVILAVLQFAVYFWSFQVASNAAREGARRYAVSPCTAAANDALTKDRVGAAAESPVVVAHQFHQDTVELETGDAVTVTVTFSTHDLSGGLIPLPETVTKSSTARVEDAEDC